VLRVAKKIKLIDPYYDITKLRYRKLLAAILKKIYDYRDTSSDIRIELHTGIERYFRKGEHRTDQANYEKYIELVTKFKKTLPSILSHGVKVKLVIWKERENGQELHNRFVLTEFIVLMYGQGLDANLNYRSESIDNVAILLEQQRQQINRLYGSTCPAFDYAGEPIEIVGKKALK
jgi:hypothetical protein